jgi:hypothetical protein
MSLTPEQEAHAHAIWSICQEVGCIRNMARDLLRDIDAGKEPDGQFPKVYREDRGKRMTLKVARNRLHHIHVRLAKLTQDIPT